MKSNRVMITILIILMAFFAFQIAGCGPMDELTEEDDTAVDTITVGQIELQASAASVDADGSSRITITAKVKTSSNQAISATDVTFETTRGSITSPHETDDYGEAVAEIISDRYNDSSVTVTAMCQGIVGTLIIAFTGVDLSLEAEPDNLLAGGEASSTITATLNDAAGNPIASSTINFSTDRGTLSAFSSTTDSSGEAEVNLISSSSGKATVTATGNGATATTEVDFTLNLFTIAAGLSTIRVSENTTITATLSGDDKSGKTVTLSTTLGTLSSSQVATAADGTASTTLNAGVQAGVATIGASVTVSSIELTASTQVTVTGGNADKIVLSAAPSVIATDDGETTITASVYDATDQPAGNQTIFFRINDGPSGGENLADAQKTTNSVGITSVQFYAGTLPSTIGGVVIEANTEADFTGSWGLTDLTIAGPVAEISVGQSMHELRPLGGHMEVDVSAVATDVTGNPVPDSTKVNFSVISVEFDEDRDDDDTIDCWDSIGDDITCTDYYTGDPDNPIIIQGTPGQTWFTDDVNLSGTLDFSVTEDTNGNGILDTGEDINENGVIDPIGSCVIAGSVETLNGVATAVMTYPQPHAANIRVRITAESGGVQNFYETVLLCTKVMTENGVCGIDY